jgi:hypothetical protein
MATVFCYDSFFLFTQDSNNIQILNWMLAPSHHSSTTISDPHELLLANHGLPYHHIFKIYFFVFITAVQNKIIFHNATLKSMCCR